MSIREKEELLRRSAQRYEDAAQEYKKAGEHLKAAEALRNAARALEKAEEVAPDRLLQRARSASYGRTSGEATV